MTDFRSWKVRLPRTLAAALLIATASQAALGQLPKVKSFSANEGLPSSPIFDLAEDPSGRIWILNRAGLAVYDGRGFTYHNEKTGVTPGEHGAVTVDSIGRVWTVTRWVGPAVDRWEAGDPSWTRLPSPPPSLRLGQRNTHSINALAVLPGAGEGGRDLVAVATLGYGLYLWTGAAWSLLGADQGLPGDRVFDLLAFDGKIAAAASGGLCLLSGIEPDCSLGQREPRLSEGVVALARTTEGNGRPRLWLLGHDFLGYLDDGRLRIVTEPPLWPSIPGPGALSVDRGGGVYFGSRFGAFFLDAEGRGVRSVGIEDGLNGEGVTALHTDRDGNVWLGGARGLNKIPVHRFFSYDSRQGLAEDEVSALFEAAPGRLIVGHNQGLSFFENGRATSTLVWGRQENGPFGSYRAMQIFRGSDGAVWVAASRLGLLRLDGQGSYRTTLVNETIHSATLDSRNRWWVVANGNLKTGDGQRFHLVEALPPSRKFRWLVASPGGRLYAASRQGLFWREDSWDESRWRQALGASPKSNNVYGVAEDPAKATWVATEAGLYELKTSPGEPHDELLRVERDGLAIDDPVYSILVDREGLRWFGTDDGVRVWDGTRTRRLSVNQGLAGQETNRGAALVDRSGRVWIGTNRGLSVYRRRYDPTPAVPVVEIAAIEVEGEDRSHDEELHLSPGQNNITFRYRTITQADAGELLVRYRLDGYGEPPPVPEPANETAIRYTNLPPGEYRFGIAAGWADGPWSAETVTPRITIARPLYRRPGLWVLAALSAGLAVYGTHRLRVRALRKVNAELQEYVEERDRALAERDRLIGDLAEKNRELDRLIDDLTLKSRELERYTYTVSHDLKAPLVTIKGFLGYLKSDSEKGRQDKVIDDIARIESAAERMGHLLDDLLELSRIGRVKKPFEEVPISELARQAADLAAGGIAAVAAEVEIAPDLGSVHGDRTRLLELFQNLIENAAKYMGEQPQPRIVVGALRGAGSAARVFFVRDNGQGIAEPYLNKVFGLFERLDTATEGTGVGLTLARRIVEIHGGRIWAESEGAGKGATFFFTLPGEPGDLPAPPSSPLHA